MQANYFHFTFLLDGSGSMDDLIEPMKEALIKYFNEQKKLEGKMTFSVHTFTTTYSEKFFGAALKYETLADFQLLTQDTNLDLSKYTADSGTPLYDATCKCIDELGAKLAALPEEERPEKVVFITVTDGFANSDKHHTKADVQARIAVQENQYNWQFVYMGANQDSHQVAQDLNYSNAKGIANFLATSQGVKEGFVNLTKATTSYRSGHSRSLELEPEEK